MPKGCPNSLSYPWFLPRTGWKRPGAALFFGRKATCAIIRRQTPYRQPTKPPRVKRAAIHSAVAPISALVVAQTFAVSGAGSRAPGKQGQRLCAQKRPRFNSSGCLCRSGPEVFRSPTKQTAPRPWTCIRSTRDEYVPCSMVRRRRIEISLVSGLGWRWFRKASDGLWLGGNPDRPSASHQMQVRWPQNNFLAGQATSAAKINAKP